MPPIVFAFSVLTTVHFEDATTLKGHDVSADQAWRLNFIPAKRCARTKPKPSLGLCMLARTVLA
jgi:hypothetical protein